MNAPDTRPVRFVLAGVPGYPARQRRRGRSLLHVGIRVANAKATDPTLEKRLGRTPRTLADFVREQRSVWDKPSAPSGAPGQGSR